jgi:hypothetical protein
VQLDRRERSVQIDSRVSQNFMACGIFGTSNLRLHHHVRRYR